MQVNPDMLLNFHFLPSNKPKHSNYDDIKYKHKYNNNEKVWKIARITKMRHRDMK